MQKTKELEEEIGILKAIYILNLEKKKTEDSLSY